MGRSARSLSGSTPSILSSRNTCSWMSGASSRRSTTWRYSRASQSKHAGDLGAIFVFAKGNGVLEAVREGEHLGDASRSRCGTFTGRCAVSKSVSLAAAEPVKLAAEDARSVGCRLDSNNRASGIPGAIQSMSPLLCRRVG